MIEQDSVPLPPSVPSQLNEFDLVLESLSTLEA